MNLRDDSWRALNKALSRAVSDGLIPRNAVTSVKPPQPRRAEIRPLDREQVREREATGPNGQWATVTDNVIAVRRLAW
jgi:hypothetical protein